MKIVFRFSLTILVASILTGCAGQVLNEGATAVNSKQVFKSSPGDDSGSPVLIDLSSEEFVGVYFPPDYSAAAAIEKDSYFSVSLLSAHICGFNEGRGLWTSFRRDHSNPKDPNDKSKDWWGCEQGGVHKPKKKDRTTRGEIAIIVNTGETSETSGLTIRPEEMGTAGRVIYYNEDLRESGQLINAVNIPIYGPKKYDGKNFFFELSMLELDNDENTQIKNLMASMANLGGTAYPPSAPILGVLNNLGGSLLTGEADDVELKFQMRFDVKGPSDSQVWRLPFAEGYYAFFREENRDWSPVWHQLAVDVNNGVLCYRKDVQKNEVEIPPRQALQGKYTPKTGLANQCDPHHGTFRSNTWFLVRIAKETKEAALDIEYGEQLSQFVELLSKKQAADYDLAKAEMDKLQESLKELMCIRSAKDDAAKKKCTKNSAGDGDDGDGDDGDGDDGDGDDGDGDGGDGDDGDGDGV